MRTINLLSVVTGTIILVLSMVIQGSLQTVYAVEKVDTIKVSPRPIHVTLGGQQITVYHLFVVYTQKQQQQQQQQELPIYKDYVCQGIPIDPATGQIPPSSDLPVGFPSSFLLKGRCIPFESDNDDYPFRQMPSTTLVSGAQAKDVYRCFVKATNAFNDATIPYILLPTSSELSGNSNSYVRAILDNCHIPGGDSRIPVPAQLAPGWSITGLP